MALQALITEYSPITESRFPHLELADGSRVGREVALIQSLCSSKAVAELAAPLIKATVEQAVSAEFDHDQQQHPIDETRKSYRNGYLSKQVKTDHVDVSVRIPRDRAGDFQPQFIRKGYTRLGIDFQQFLYLFAKGLEGSVRDNVITEMYSDEVSPELVNVVKGSIANTVIDWQSRSLYQRYSAIYLDRVDIKISAAAGPYSESVLIAVALLPDGRKELVGLWLQSSLDDALITAVRDDLTARGVREIQKMYIDGCQFTATNLQKRFPDTEFIRVSNGRLSNSSNKITISTSRVPQSRRLDRAESGVN